MKLATYKKQPNERLRYNIDYSSWLATGESIASVTLAFEALNLSGGGEPTLTENVAYRVLNSQDVTLYIENGTDGGNYKMTVTMTSTGNEIKEDEVYYNVEDV